MQSIANQVPQSEALPQPRHFQAAQAITGRTSAPPLTKNTGAVMPRQNVISELVLAAEHNFSPAALKTLTANIIKEKSTTKERLEIIKHILGAGTTFTKKLNVVVHETWMILIADPDQVWQVILRLGCELNFVLKTNNNCNKQSSAPKQRPKLALIFLNLKKFAGATAMGRDKSNKRLTPFMRCGDGDLQSNY